MTRLQILFIAIYKLHTHNEKATEKRCEQQCQMMKIVRVEKQYGGKRIPTPLDNNKQQTCEREREREKGKKGTTTNVCTADFTFSMIVVYLLMTSFFSLSLAHSFVLSFMLLHPTSPPPPPSNTCFNPCNFGLSRADLQQIIDKSRHVCFSILFCKHTNTHFDYFFFSSTAQVFRRLRKREREKEKL
jgi:hypothetical protein